ncbi:MAG TPA: hypothetical protein VF030_07875 [Solirubrobacterales bacterium]
MRNPLQAANNARWQARVWLIEASCLALFSGHVEQRLVEQAADALAAAYVADPAQRSFAN